VNEIHDIIKLELEVSYLQRASPEEWAKFTRFLQENEIFRIDARTAMCLPNSVVFFTKPFL